MSPPNFIIDFVSSREKNEVLLILGLVGVSVFLLNHMHTFHYSFGNDCIVELLHSPISDFILFFADTLS